MDPWQPFDMVKCLLLRIRPFKKVGRSDFLIHLTIIICEKNK